MTHPVSSGARWPRVDICCSDVSGDETETFTCDETHEMRCGAERAHRPTPTQLDRAPAVSDVPFGLAFCRHADTVVEGFLCSEPTVVSNACRKPRNAIDEFVCDDPRMKELEWRILRETWSILKTLALALVRGKG
jgi:hypothetical protein